MQKNPVYRMYNIISYIFAVRKSLNYEIKISFDCFLCNLLVCCLQ